MDEDQNCPTPPSYDFVTIRGIAINLSNVTYVSIKHYSSGKQIRINFLNSHVDFSPYDNDKSKSGEFSIHDGAWKFYQWLMDQGASFTNTKMLPVSDLFEDQQDKDEES